MDGNSLQIAYAVVGKKAAGKGTFGARLAEKHGFTVFTMSTPMRAMATKEVGPDYAVADLVRIADRERAKHGAGYWATELLRLANEQGVRRLCVDGVRNPGEIEALRAGLPEGVPLILIGIVAPFKRRFEWAKKRLQSGDPLTEEGFRRMDEIDLGGPSQPEHGQQVARCLGMVPPENVYDNAKSLEAYHGWIDGQAARDLDDLASAQ